MKAQVQFYRPVQDSLVLVRYARSGESGETAHLRSITRAFANYIRDIDEGPVKFYKPVQESLVLNAYASSESLKRRDVRDVGEGSGQKLRDSS